MYAIILIAVITAVLAIIRSFYSKNLYWKERGVKGPPTKLFSGNLDDVTRLDFPVPLQWREWTKKYGSVYGYFEGSKKVLVVSDPDMLHELFVKKFDHFYGRKLGIMNPNVDEDPKVHVFNARGHRWKRLRSLANPAFSSSSLKMIKPTVEDSAKEMIRHLEKHVDGQAINIHQFFQEYTMDVISRVSMGQKESKQFQNVYMNDVNKLFKMNIQNNFVYTAFMFPSVRHWMRSALVMVGKLTGGSLPFLSIQRKIETAVADRMKERESLVSNDSDDERQAKDFIDMFLDAKVDERNDEAGFSKSALNISKTLTKDEVVAQCTVFLLAGFDTTANSLAYISHELSKHPRVMKKIQQELDEVLTGDEISYEDLGKLKYMEQAVRESLRMWPLAAFANSRECSIPTTLGDIPVEEGTRVVADCWTIHYDKKIWGDDADEFKPERWESTDRRHIMSWFPFGAGPRQCVGMRLALMEEKLALAHILRRFDIVQADEPQKELKLFGSFTTSPEAVNICLKTRSA